MTKNNKKLLADRGQGKIERTAKDEFLTEEEISGYLKHLSNQEALLPNIREAFQECGFVNPTTKRPDGVTGVDPFEFVSKQISNARSTLIAAQPRGGRTVQHVYSSHILKHCHDIDELIISMAAAAFAGKGDTDYLKRTEKSSYSSKGGKKGGKTRKEADPEGKKAFVRRIAHKLCRDGVADRLWAGTILIKMENEEKYHDNCPSKKTISAWCADIKEACRSGKKGK